MPPKGKRASTGSMPAPKRRRDDQEETTVLGEITGNSLSAGRAKETSLFRKLSDAKTSTAGTAAEKSRANVIVKTVSDAQREQEYQEMLAVRDAMKDKIWAKAQKERAAMEAEDSSSGSSGSAESVESDDEARDARAGLKRLKRMMRRGAFMDSTILERLDAVRADIADVVGEADMDLRFKMLNKRVEKLETQMRTADKDRTTIFEVLNDRLKNIETNLEVRLDRQESALDALMRANLSREELMATGQYVSVNEA